MVRDTPFIVTIEPSSESRLATTMNDVRLWLDHRRVQVILFEPISQNYGITGFRIGFRTEDEAELFRQEFGGVKAA